ncbi:MAG: helix-turn-helix domain-containing protein [Planctomycetota bacterium]
MLRMTPRAFDFATFSVAWDADRRMEPHVHEDHELNIAVQGSGRYELADGRALHFSAGQILFLPGGWVHALRSDGPLTFRGLLVHPDLFARLQADLLGKPWEPASAAVHLNAAARSAPSTPPVDAADRRAAEAEARRLTDLADPLPPRVVVAPQLYQTLLELYGQTQVEVAQADAWNRAALADLARLTAVSVLRLIQIAAPAAAGDPVLERVHNVRAWIDRHFAEAIALDDLAAMANLSPSHFSALFHRAIGAAPKAYLLERRLDQAGRLLSQTGLSIVEVAWSVGFNHLAHFNRSFKTHTGLTPGAFRKKHQKEQRKT